jgi:TonB family protein
MPKKVFFNLLLFVFMFAFSNAASVAAQTNVCLMKMNVTANQGETKITGATAIATSKQTEKVYKSVLKGGMPYFAALPTGNYRVSVSKAGYKRTIDDFRLDCSEANIEPWSIELFKGSPRQVVNAYSRVLKSSPLTRAEAADFTEADTGTSPTDSNKYELAPNQPNSVSGGVLNGKATNLVKPEYPKSALAVRASGAVNVQVTIDEEGKVISASAVSGHPLLRAAAVKAARESTFPPTRLSGQPVKVTGIIVYNFVP